jgi:hypothetical protein
MWLNTYNIKLNWGQSVAWSGAKYVALHASRLGCIFFGSISHQNCGVSYQGYQNLEGMDRCSV